MANRVPERDIAPTLSAAEKWIESCLIGDRAVFSPDCRWTAALIEEVYRAFVDHPNSGEDDFMTKLKGQMKNASPAAQQLMAEMLWALLLFPSNMKAATKRRQICDLWALSEQALASNDSLLRDDVLIGIGSGGPGFNSYRPQELTYLIALARDLKERGEEERRCIFGSYDAFFLWIDSVPREGSRQFRHMLRYFAFPHRVERISSNNDRRKILKAFGVASARDIASFSDRQLDEGLLELRSKLQSTQNSLALDFYEPKLKEKWSSERRIKTAGGEVLVTVPDADDELDDKELVAIETNSPDARQSIQIQSKLAKIGTIMGFKIWIPRADKGRVQELLRESERASLLEELPLNYEIATLATIEQIDVLWLRGRSIARAFEVEHTTAIYSGILRMADLLALQPNMDIRLHIVAPEERREKVFREMKRPVFSLLERGPLSRSCTFISYDNVTEISKLEHLAFMNDGIIAEYEEKAE